MAPEYDSAAINASVFEDPDVELVKSLLIWFYGSQITLELLEQVIPAFLDSKKAARPFVIEKSPLREDVVRLLYESAKACPKNLLGEFQFAFNDVTHRMYISRTTKRTIPTKKDRSSEAPKKAAVQHLNPEIAGAVVISKSTKIEEPPKVQTSASMQGTKIRIRRPKVTDVGPGMMPTTEQVGCYCNSKSLSPETLGAWSDLRCSKCHTFFHGRCTQQNFQKPLLPGDIYYTFICRTCHGDSELFAKQAKTWPQVLQIVFYNLTSGKRGGRSDPPNDNLEYFSLDELCTFAITHRASLAIKGMGDFF